MFGFFYLMVMLRVILVILKDFGLLGCYFLFWQWEFVF